jgi:hypothetical protein
MPLMARALIQLNTYNRIKMSFPTSPSNGQVAIVNNIAYQYSVSTNSWQRYVTGINYGGNITAGTLTTTNGLFWANGTPYLNYSNSNVAAYLSSYSGALNPLTLNVGGTTTLGGSVNFNATGYQINNFNGRPMLLQTGGILQVVQTILNTTTSLAPNGTATAVPGMSASITPTSTSSQIWILMTLSYGATGTTYGGYFTRNGTAIGLGVAGSGQQQVGFGMAFSTDANQLNTFPYSYLDSPATTSTVTYQLYVNNDSTSAVYINRSQNDSANSTGKRSISTVTLLEIAR